MKVGRSDSDSDQIICGGDIGGDGSISGFLIYDINFILFEIHFELIYHFL